MRLLRVSALLLLLPVMLMAQPPALVDSTIVPPRFDMTELRSHLYYPAEALEKKEEGTVRFMALIDTNGRVKQTRVYVVDTSDLVMGAVAAAKLTRFVPAKRRGHPVEAWVEIAVAFRLADTARLQRDPTEEGVYGSAYFSGPTFDKEDLMQRVRYPDEARVAGIEGRVVMRVQLSSTGVITHMAVASFDHPTFIESAFEALDGLPIEPMTIDGEPVGVWLQIPIEFKLR